MNLSERERHLLSRALTRFSFYLFEKKDFEKLNELDDLEKKLGFTIKDLQEKNAKL